MNEKSIDTTFYFPRATHNWESGSRIMILRDGHCLRNSVWIDWIIDVHRGPFYTFLKHIIIKAKEVLNFESTRLDAMFSSLVRQGY